MPILSFFQHLLCSNKENLSLMSGGHFSAGDSGCKSQTCLASDARIYGGKNKCYGVGEGRGLSHMWETFFSFYPSLLVTAGVRPPSARDAFKVAPVQPGVGVTEVLMWAQPALWALRKGKRKKSPGRPLLSAQASAHICLKGTNTRGQPNVNPLYEKKKTRTKITKTLAERLRYSCKGKLSVWLWPKSNVVRNAHTPPLL